MTQAINYQALYLKRARRIAFVLTFVPFVRMIGVTGSVARGEARADSDIDLYIVARAGRLYTVRFFVTVLVHIFGMRRYANHIKGRICLNRYHSNSHLKEGPNTDYRARELANMTPLIDYANVYEEFKKANSWVVDHGFVFTPFQTKPVMQLALIRGIRRLREYILARSFGDWLEMKLRNFQLRYAQNNQTTKGLRDDVIFSDTQLLFHPDQRRREA